MSFSRKTFVLITISTLAILIDGSKQVSQSETCPFESMAMFRTCSFEVFGRVQGVYFRKYTQDQARNLHLVGTVQNTSKGTVIGVIQGTRENIETMKIWLRTTGSPSSKIERVEFTEERDIDAMTYTSFDIVR